MFSLCRYECLGLCALYSICFCMYCHPGELGDCDPLEHSPELVSEFRFAPKQSEAMEADIFSRWLELRWEKNISYIQCQVCSKTFEVAKMGHFHQLKPRTRSTCICTSCHNTPAVSKPLIGGFPVAGDLTWAGFCSHWMKQLGQKAEHWAEKEVILLLPFIASISTDDDRGTFHCPSALSPPPPRPRSYWSVQRIKGLIPGGSWLIPGSI